MDKEFEFSTGLTSEREEIVKTLNLGDALLGREVSQTASLPPGVVPPHNSETILTI